MIDRHLEEALDLIGVQVHGHHPVHTGGGEHVRHKLCSDGDPRLVLPILARHAEIRDHGHDPFRTCAACRIHHQQQFEKIVAGRKGALHDEDQFAANGLLEARLDLAIAEVRHGDLAQLLPAHLHDLLGEVTRGGSTEDLGTFLHGSVARPGLRGCKCSDLRHVINTSP